jgi:hypothetical protein
VWSRVRSVAKNISAAINNMSHKLLFVRKLRHEKLGNVEFNTHMPESIGRKERDRRARAGYCGRDDAY